MSHFCAFSVTSNEYESNSSQIHSIQTEIEDCQNQINQLNIRYNDSISSSYSNDSIFNKYLIILKKYNIGFTTYRPDSMQGRVAHRLVKAYCMFLNENIFANIVCNS